MTLRTALFFIVTINFILGALLLLILPQGAYSLDLANYLEVLSVLDRGGNPYEETTHLNYAPAWLQILWLLGKLAGPEAAARAFSIKIFNAAIAALTSCILCYAISDLRSIRQAFWLTLFGFVLNPVIILLVYLHGSFDPLVALAIATCLFLFNFAAKQRSTKAWLAASLTLGSGILLKTMPVILLPILFLRQKWLSKSALLGGIILAVSPFIIGIGILYILSPEATSAKVLSYASIPGYFGITGISRIAGLSGSFDPYYTTLFRLLLILGLLSAIIFLRLKSLKTSELVYRYALVATLFVVALGPGFGTQYLLWTTPLMLLRLGLSDAVEKRIVFLYGSFYFISSATYIYEYSHFAVLSGTLAQFASGTSNEPMLAMRAAVWRLPLFLIMCTVLIVEAQKLIGTPSNKTDS